MSHGNGALAHFHCVYINVPLTTMSVKPLGEALRSSLLSGVAVTSLVQCVEELVYNSIDAGSSCIAVRLDISKYKVQVV